MPMNEADTRTKLIDPPIHARGWTEDLVRCEETAGAIEIIGGVDRRPAAGELADLGGAGRRRGAAHGGRVSPSRGDATGFWRPHLQGCPTPPYHAAAGKALPAIPLGILARVGSAHGQRLGVPLALVRAGGGAESAGA